MQQNPTPHGKSGKGLANMFAWRFTQKATHWTPVLLHGTQLTPWPPGGVAEYVNQLCWFPLPLTQQFRCIGTPSEAETLIALGTKK